MAVIEKLNRIAKRNVKNACVCVDFWSEVVSFSFTLMHKFNLTRPYVIGKE